MVLSRNVTAVRSTTMTSVCSLASSRSSCANMADDTSCSPRNDTIHMAPWRSIVIGPGGGEASSFIARFGTQTDIRCGERGQHIPSRPRSTRGSVRRRDVLSTKPALAAAGWRRRSGLLAGDEVGGEGVQVGVVGGARADLVEVIEAARCGTLGAEPEAGSLQLGDRREDVLETRLAAVRRTRSRLFRLFFHEHAIVSEQP